MLRIRFRGRFIGLLLASLWAASAAWLTLHPVQAAQPDAPVNYNHDIRPILSNNCYKCHGPDAEERKAGLRLDNRTAALTPTESGRKVILPGKPDASLLIRRINSNKPDFIMPPPDSNKKLTAAEKELLKRWIAQGAQYQELWSFVPPRRPSLPNVVHSGWPRNGVDYFILSRLEAEGLQPSPEADKTTLIRRLTLDLTGLPPAPAEVDAFIADTSPDAYDKVVDRLLASPHYGERLAVDWLDAARFADTHGYHIDSGRDMSRWRGWVINAFNRNMPFDQFTVDQLAGDLLPNATVGQRIASGFNRNHMINFEGGAIPEEYHTAYLVDRVNTTSTVWLGLTIACAQCHDHKYDPITQKEYYQLFAFFNNVPEKGLDGQKGNAAPVLKLPTPEQKQQLANLDASIKQLEEQLKKSSPEPNATRTKPLQDQLAKRRRERTELEKQIPTTMVMEEMPKPRDTFMLIRGQYDKKGEKVTAGVPASLPPLPSGAPANRLGLARWLVAPGQPLTARVIVNRYWQMFFGTGIVKTAEDFGSQGELPSHPQLLDWLAVEFMNPSGAPAGSGAQQPWDIKALLRLIATSATYRQTSVVSPKLLAKDPENRLLARGPRLRLQAEFIRDQALAVSGLLDEEVGGHSVSPYQPPGLWEELMSRQDGKNWTAQTYVQSHGKDLYRRTMYTFWKRTSPPPTLVTFDAPDREICTVRRPRTNTPLQALVLMNDPTYLEASRKLAERIMLEAGDIEQRIELAYRLAMARRPKPAEVAVLRRIFEEQLAVYRANPAAALKLLSVGEFKRNEKLDVTELAAWATVASVILNLDETVTKG
jgi:mono/diheme cytochrome c family protein